MIGNKSNIKNLGSSFEKLKLYAQLKDAVKDNKSLIAIGIRLALNDKKATCQQVFDYIKEQGNDNIPLMQSVIGVELCNKILNLK